MHGADAVCDPSMHCSIITRTRQSSGKNSRQPSDQKGGRLGWPCVANCLIRRSRAMHAWTNEVREPVRKITGLGGTVPDDELIVVLTNNLPNLTSRLSFPSNLWRRASSPSIMLPIVWQMKKTDSKRNNPRSRWLSTRRTRRRDHKLRVGTATRRPFQ
jgi:hypothetical protein